MKRIGRVWTRWKRIAHRAAEIQALVVLTVVYWIAVAPIGILLRRRNSSPATWRVRETAETASLSTARRQY